MMHCCNIDSFEGHTPPQPSKNYEKWQMGAIWHRTQNTQMGTMWHKTENDRNIQQEIMVIVCVWLWKLQLHGKITNGNNVTQNTKHTNLFNEKKITLYQHLSKRTRTNLQLGQFWWYINWFKIALQIKLQFYLSYGSFVVHLWPLDLSIKAGQDFSLPKSM